LSVAASYSRRHQDSRTIRVFISSTFRDMMRERDLLVKEVFPSLRRRCAQRMVTFTEVDLRWGITGEQAAEGMILPLCLAEIQRCRPYFIGLLGERYGWIPTTIPDAVLRDKPWLVEHLDRQTSVTELEILHGVLNNPAMATHAVFYFRDPRWIATLAENERREMVERDIPQEIARFGAEEATRRTRERRKRLESLKDRIRHSGLPLIENYESPSALAAIIRKQFEDLIDRLYPEADAPHASARERFAHESYAQSKLFACIPRPRHLKKLDGFTDKEHAGRGLAITGESGAGKTVLLAAWALRRSDTGTNEYLFQHYFGSTPDSTSVDRFLQRMLEELQHYFGIEDEIPDNPQALRRALPTWLSACRQGRIILVLDGLNQIQGDEGDRRLAWLPSPLPPHVTVLASCLPGSTLDELHERGWEQYEVPLADEAEIGEMIDGYLEEFRKTLDEDLRRQLIAAPGSSNPLFLRSVLEELRQFGDYESLPGRMTHYLTASSPRELFRRILQRWRNDFDMGQDIVRRALSDLWAARQGLSEPESLALLGKDGDPLPRALWSPLFLAMEPHLARRGELLAFGHEYLRRAVQDVFLPGRKDRQRAHVRLADHFERGEPGPRKTAELPWQYAQAGQKRQLIRVLTDLDMFLSLADTNRFEIWQYWHDLDERYPPHYEEAILRWKRDYTGPREVLERALNELAHFYYVSGNKRNSLPIIRESCQLAQEMYGENDIRVAIRRNNLAGGLVAMQQYAQAEELAGISWPVIRDHFGEDDERTWAARSAHGVCLLKTGQLDEARTELETIAEWFLQHLGENHHSTIIALDNLGAVLEYMGENALAEEQRSRAEKAAIRLLGEEHPLVHTLRAGLERVRKRLALAPNLPLAERSVPWLLARAGEQWHARDLDAALATLEALEKKCGLDEDKNGMARCLLLKARLLAARGELDAAGKICREALPFARDISSALAAELQSLLLKCGTAR